MSRIEWIILLSGVGTFALRWLPLRQARRRLRRPLADAAPSALQRLLAGIGPAAIAALLMVSLLSLPATAGPAQGLPGRQIIAAALALLLVWLLRLRVKGIAMPTLAGALAYGLLLQWL
ncbi:branched-chain amino acid transport [Corticibacter populi]|uniref:Branched-chain amino acid transport n=1 Tax=Corticibacter populi TaxID=1550736 RepID=A0A3M6R043_9BURK|nr:AzlD domain-containing protein [Corticibacter populi]RMX08637.1 branched-chain amino acid transport [Corticibacter populi]RZS35969.1 branched-subunit amino acid transport protein AzlD [Corticibacter populi]